MATYLIQDTTLSSIADAIRAKAGKSDAFSPAQMVSEIENLPTGGGGDMGALIERTISVVENSTASKVGSYVFAYCSALTSVNLPSATTIGSYAFYQCSALTSVNLPSATKIGTSAFTSCRALTSVNLPSATTINNYAFSRCYKLLSLYLMNSVICTLSSSYAFTSTPIAGYTASTGGVYGSIYVPASLFESYKTATNWSRFSYRFVSLMGIVTWGYVSADAHRYARIRDTEGNIKNGILTIATPDGTSYSYQEGTHICDETMWDELSPSYGYSYPATFNTGTNSQSLTLLRSDYDEPFVGYLTI